MPQTRHEQVTRIRMQLGAALLEVQNLGKRHREAVARLETAYMELAEITALPPGPHSVQHIA